MCSTARAATPYPEDAPANRSTCTARASSRASGRSPRPAAMRWSCARAGSTDCTAGTSRHHSPPCRGARRAAHRRGPDRRPQLGRRARRGDGPHRGVWAVGAGRAAGILSPVSDGRGELVRLRLRDRRRCAAAARRADRDVEYPLPARRPPYGVLARPVRDVFGLRSPIGGRRCGLCRGPRAAGVSDCGRGAMRGRIARRQPFSAGRTYIRRLPSSGCRSSWRRSWP